MGITQEEAYEMIRAKHRRTTKEMGDIMGVTKQTYSNWSHGKFNGFPQVLRLDTDKMEELYKLWKETKEVYDYFNSDNSPENHNI